MEPRRDPSAIHSRIPITSLLGANAVSLFGSMLTMIALPWFVLQTTGSASRAGITLAVDSVPIVFAGLFGGVLVDRIGYKPSSVFADLASALMVGAIPLLYLTVGITFWQLLVFVFLGASVNQPGRTARLSLIPNLADQVGMPLVRVNSIAQAIPRFALLFGPPVAGMLVALIGATNVLWIDAASFLLSAAIVAVGVTGAGPTCQPTQPTAAGGIMAGLRYIARDRLLLAIMITFAVGSLIAEPLYTIVYPVYARKVYGSAVVLGLMYSSLAIGSLIGLALYSVFGPRIPYRVVLLGGFAVRAVSFWILVTLPTLPLLLGSIMFDAICFEPINPLVTSLLQERTTAGLRGRVFGAFSAIGAGTLPFGTMIGGLLLGGPGLVPTLVIISSASVAHVISLFAIPAFRTDQPMLTGASAGL